MSAASVWDSAGADYERISFHLADAVEHAALRLAPKPGERILDLATGTGWGARRLAAQGAVVTGVDLGEKLLAAAGKFAKIVGLTIDFRVADAEQLPFEPASFDAVLSTFGVMFVSRPEAAAAELARVCKPGGRIVLVSWTPESTVARKWEMTRPYAAASTEPSPFAWGTRDRLKELLGGSFDLRFETGVSMLRLAGSEAAWDLFVRGYGPTRALVAGLPPEKREAYQRDFVAFYEGFRTDLGIAVPRDYLLAFGRRSS